MLDHTNLGRGWQGSSLQMVGWYWGQLRRLFFENLWGPSTYSLIIKHSNWKCPINGGWNGKINHELVISLTTSDYRRVLNVLPRINHLHQWLDIYWHFRRKVERWQKRCTKNPGRQLMVIDGSQRRNSRDGIKVSKKKGILAITPRIPFQANEFVLAKKFCIWLSHVKRHQDGVLRWWSLRFSCDTHGPNIFGSDQKCRTPRGCFQQTPRKHEGSIRAKRKLGSSDFEVYI